MKTYLFCKGYSIDHLFPHRVGKEKEDIANLLKRDGLEIISLPQIISQEQYDTMNKEDVCVWESIEQCDTIGTEAGTIFESGDQCPQVVGTMCVEDMNDGLVITYCSQQESKIACDCIEATGGEARCFEMNEGWDKNMENTFENWWDTEGYELCYRDNTVKMEQGLY